VSDDALTCNADYVLRDLMLLGSGGSVAAGQAHRGRGERGALPRLKGV